MCTISPCRWEDKKSRLSSGLVKLRQTQEEVATLEEDLQEKVPGHAPLTPRYRSIGGLAEGKKMDMIWTSYQSYRGVMLTTFQMMVQDHVWTSSDQS